MPVKSEAQRRAMFAALKGRSSLGISRETAKKFLSHGKPKGGSKPPPRKRPRR